jgi:hypothetical protein
VNETTIDRQALADLLARFGDSLDSFDALRPDAYEKVLAAQPSGLEFLESFYSLLFDPALTLAQAAEKCPTWPLGSKRERRRPSPNILSQVGERMRTRAALARISPVGKFLTELRKELKATPLGDNQTVLDGLCGAVGAKLLADARAGTALDLKAMATLQNQRVLEQNEQRLAQNDKKLANDGRRLALLEAREAKTKEVVNNTTLSPEEKQQRIREILGTE